MNSDSMDEDLVEELDYVKELLIKSGFFSTEDMLEILKDLKSVLRVKAFL